MKSQNSAKTAWNPSGIALLSVFFSFFPAGILYAYNFARLGKQKFKWPIILIVTLLFAFALILLLKYDNENFQALNILAALVFYFSQKPAFQDFLKDGGHKASFKQPLLYSFIFIFTIFAGILGFYQLQTQSFTLTDDRFENEYITATIPKGWNAHKNEYGDTDTIIYLVKENGIANISIDHTQDFLNIPNATTIKNYKPRDILDDRLKSLEETIKADPSLNWKNFRRVDAIQEANIKGLSAAEGTFIVDENILGAKEKTERKIKRIVIFTHDDLFNIVFASTDASKFTEEEKEFNSFLDSLTIKK